MSKCHLYERKLTELFSKCFGNNSPYKIYRSYIKIESEHVRYVDNSKFIDYYFGVAKLHIKESNDYNSNYHFLNKIEIAQIFYSKLMFLKAIVAYLYRPLKKKISYNYDNNLSNHAYSKIIFKLLNNVPINFDVFNSIIYELVIREFDIFLPENGRKRLRQLCDELEHEFVLLMEEMFVNKRILNYE